MEGGRRRGKERGRELADEGAREGKGEREKIGRMLEGGREKGSE